MVSCESDCRRDLYRDVLLLLVFFRRARRPVWQENNSISTERTETRRFLPVIFICWGPLSNFSYIINFFYLFIPSCMKSCPTSGYLVTYPTPYLCMEMVGRYINPTPITFTSLPALPTRFGFGFSSYYNILIESNIRKPSEHRKQRYYLLLLLLVI